MKLTKQERKNRVIARGEISNHCHVITGDCTIRNEKGEILIDVESDGDAILKHLLETDWMGGKEVWTKEHADIPLKKGTYKYVQQVEYDPYNEIIVQVKD